MIRLMVAVYLTTLAFCKDTDVISEKRNPPWCKYPLVHGYMHTVCEFANTPPRPKGLTAKEKKHLLDEHNKRRGNVAVPGTDLQTMVWDKELEESAQAWVKRCIFTHDKNRWHNKYNINAGQNIAYDWDPDVISSALIGWWDEEVKIFRWGVKDSRTWHYTQMAQSRAVKLGCARGICHDFHYLACNYVAPNFNVIEPYKRGPRASACSPSFRKKGLCDCGGKFCANGGTIDLQTCKCLCTDEHDGLECEKERKCDGSSCIKSSYGCVNARGPFWSGPKCGTADPGWCKTWPCSNLCGVGGEHRLSCPHTCGICKSVTECQQPLCYTSFKGCKNWDGLWTKEKCRQIAPMGRDGWWCTRNYSCIGQCNSGKRFKEACPYMCGLCK